MEGPRPLRPEEFDSLIEMINDVFSPERRTMREAFPLLFSRENAGNLFVFVDEGRVVSHVGILLGEIIVNSCRLLTASVGSVGTRPEYRGKGLAGKCLDAAEKRAVDEGASVMLISGQRSLYERFGAIRVGSALAYRVPAGPPGEGVMLRRGDTGDLETLASLYGRKPVRFHRPLEDWKKTVAALRFRAGWPKCHGLFLIESGGEQVAYVLSARYNRDDGPFTHVREFAGDPDAIAAALPAVAAHHDSPWIEMKAADFDPATRRALERAGHKGRREHLMGHSVKVSSAASFLRALAALVEERIGSAAAGALQVYPSADGGAEICVGEDRISFSPREFTALAFGQPEGTSLAEGNLAANVLSRVFPAPLPLVGLNYV